MNIMNHHEPRWNMLKYVEIVGVVWLIYNRRKFRSQTSDNMGRWKAEVGRVREEKRRGQKRREEKKREDQRRERVRRTKMQAREKVRKLRNTVFFQWAIWPDERRKIARHCGAKHINITKSKCTKKHMFGPLLEVAMSKKCTPLSREAHYQVKMYKKPHVRTTFGSCDVEKVHAVVARSTLPSQNAQKTHVRTTFGSCDVVKVHAVVARSTLPSQNVQKNTCSDHFWKLRCRKSARRCGAKQISKSKCTKQARFGPLLEVEMSKKCTPLWREANLQVKKLKAPHVRTAFGSWDV